MAVVDYSWERPSPQVLAAAGYQAAMRYLGTKPGGRPTGRDIDSYELRRLHDAALGVGLIWETSAQAPLGGSSTGVDHAKRANQAADLLGAPDWLPIFYAVDFGATASQLASSVSAYFRGVASVTGRPIGVYGSYGTVEYVISQGLAAVAWQCAGWSGSGSGSGGTQRCFDGSRRRRSQHAVMFQDIPELPVRGRDHNHLYAPERLSSFTWHPDWTVSAGGPIVGSLSLEDLMHRSFHMPEETGDAQYDLVDEGNGLVKRRYLSGPLRALLIVAGKLDPEEVVLRRGQEGYGIRHDDLIDLLLEMPEVPAFGIHEQVTGQGWHNAAAFQRIEEQLTALPAQLADAITSALEGREAATITPEDIEAISQRTIAELLARLAE